VWDNAEWSTNNTSDNTFNTVRFYNDYQDTDTWTLGATTSRASKYLAVERRERNWGIALPRDCKTAAGGIDSDVDFRRRLRSNHIYGVFTYNNSDNTPFSVPYIILKHRISNR
jgi:hypothetical protein